MSLDACLADLDTRLDDRFEERYRSEWYAFLHNSSDEGAFVPPCRDKTPASAEWPEIHINDALNDIDLMVWEEMRSCSDVLESGGNTALCVRSNYGSSIMATLFGCDLFVMPRETVTLPTTVPLHSSDKVLQLLDAGIPNIRAGQGAIVFDTAERFLEVFANYPTIGRNIGLYHPDVQGPVDVAEVIWGSELYYEFYDNPGNMHQLLDLITDTYILFMRKWFELVPPTPECGPHWTIMHKGPIMLRNDTLMNLSSEIYKEFVRPRDQRIFDEFGGGAIHFCGHGDHYIEAMSEMDGLTAVNAAQPELNDMEIIYSNTVDKGIKLLALGADFADNSNRPLRGQVQCYPKGLCDN